jgi:asparagine synthase (glutamine-hydrolysing)
MSGIAGINQSGEQQLVNSMLDNMLHRGGNWRVVLDNESSTFGALGLDFQAPERQALETESLVRDRANLEHFAQVEIRGNSFELKRDVTGARPLYYGWTKNGALCFASEIKGLLPATRNIHEMPPGHSFDGRRLVRDSEIAIQVPMQDPVESLISGVRERLEKAVEKRVGISDIGSWLSGGLDSSLMAALARRHVIQFHTFAAGMPGAPDLEYAGIAAKHIQSTHHERVIQPDELFSFLPDVIYALESFDALLVRSSVMNYLVAQTASDFVPAVFSGEGGDELFAGYEYLKFIPDTDLPAELVDITNRLHNTALQRVDRCSSAHGTVAHVPFLDPDVLEYALRIPSTLKLRNGLEKWILREAVKDILPAPIVERPKAKFWQGAGVGELLALQAEDMVSDADFKRERNLPNGSTLNSKEELHYYRIFREHFGEFEDMAWMGRTKGAPVA